MTNKTLGYAFEMNIDILSIHPPGTSHFCWHTNAIVFVFVFVCFTTTRPIHDTHSENIILSLERLRINLLALDIHLKTAKKHL
jgi:hypothetical protein